MNQVPIKLGPLALLLTVISICLTTLAILTFATSGADMSLAKKYAETIRCRYELETQGQEWLSEGAHRAEEMTFEENGFVLHVATDAAGNVIEWRHEKTWEEDKSIGNLWNGL